MLTLPEITTLLGDKAEDILGFDSPKISQDRLYLPNPNFVDQVLARSDRSPAVKASLNRLFYFGRLAGTGYLSILPVDQGIEHTAGYSFAPNPDYFDPEKIIELAIEGGVNAVASTYGVLAQMSSFARRLPFIVKINHNELLTYPTKHDQILFASVKQAVDLGASAVGATIYFGSKESNRQITEVSQVFQAAHEAGLACILWCYLRNPAFETEKTDYHTAADLTGQANHLGATLGADIVKQKFPTAAKGFKDLKFGKYSDEMYTKLLSDHPIDLVRYQVINSYMGRVGMINSGGASGESDLKDAVYTAVVNKRAGGMGLISGRKIFKKPLKQGVKILQAIQDVYLNSDIKVVWSRQSD